jgi:hypothetical protein
MVPCTTTTLVKTRYFLSALHLKENIFSKLNKETLTIYFCEAPHIDFMSFARVEGSFILISFSPLDYFITGFVGVCVIIFIFPSCCIFFFGCLLSLERLRALVDDGWFMLRVPRLYILLRLLFTIA